ncbi:leucyl aminopeptidase [Enterobacteriaceae endosymbiont of Donacia cincticornis]|uniref:leucyl aminopeptidase n=1 Tax=Enterobacteriaceae endosymbiont of Donacia cincticornis TaxID=2675773 RepID=UPI0014497D5F|nr:leucyl aminopeptidase [Enterobacteriaceae endosymbiont of Donacia cincticornis]QJC36043.1 leucyl aminopeptidase [Enterobacteriaceae endosymbiont of Donacia cincticornis]
MEYITDKIIFPNKILLDCMVIPIFETYKLSKITENINQISNNYILNILKENNIKGKINQNITLYNIPNILCKKILIVGCGIKDELNRYKNKLVIHNTINILKKFFLKEIYWYLTDVKINNLNLYWNIRDTIDTIEHDTYQFKKFKKNKNFFKAKIKFIINNTNKNIYHVAIKHSKAINLGIKKAKDLANLPPNICTPKFLSKKAKKLTTKYKNISVKIFDKKDLKQIGMNAYLAVSKGSKNKPFMSIIEYHNNDSQPIVLLGKGITFDSGGLSLKPSTNMSEMKYDMCGAAAVYGTICTIAELQLPINIIAILAGCENMPGNNAYRPGDIIKTLSGTTVEITNTDAEGRLVLCDILTYIKKYNPKYVIDIATLTGACVIALGNNISGLMSNNKILSNKIIKASLETNDRVWELPIDDIDYINQLKSNFANLINSSSSNSAGAITAACFLSKFTNKYNWAHIDIAGTAWYYINNKAIASGRPINMLSQFLINQI